MFYQKIIDDTLGTEKRLFQMLIIEAAHDAQVVPEKITAHLIELSRLGQYNLYDEKITMDIAHFEWGHADELFSTMRHEIEHLKFNEMAGRRMVLEADLIELPKNKTDFIYQELFKNIKDSPVYGSLKDAIKYFFSSSYDGLEFQDPKHELIIRLVDESMAYYQGAKYAVKQLELMIKDKKRSELFEVQMRKNSWKKALFSNLSAREGLKQIEKESTLKEKIKLLKKRRAVQKERLKRLEAEIKRIHLFVNSLKDPDMKNFKDTIRKIYEKIGF